MSTDLEQPHTLNEREETLVNLFRLLPATKQDAVLKALFELAMKKA